MNKVVGRRLNGVGIALAAWFCAQPALARPPAPISATTLVERAQIEDMIKRYYYDLGHGSPESYTTFYTDDGELVLGKSSFKGKDNIIAAYKAAGGDGSRRRAYAFNIAINNLLVSVHGNSATAKMIFTEFIADKQGDTPRILVQGREYSELVKQKGEWKFRKRQIVGGTEPPAGWSE